MFCAGTVEVAAEEGPSWEITKGVATVVMPLTVGGSFEAKSSAFTGRLTAAAEPGALAGAIEVDLRTVDTGIEFRNSHMRDRYLEVQKGSGFDRAELSGLQIEKVDPRTAQGKLQFHGTFLLHGQRRAITGEAELVRIGPKLHIDASFPITVSDYGFARVEYLGVGIRNTIQVKVSLDAVEQEPAEPKS